MATKRKSESATYNFLAAGLKGHEYGDDPKKYARPLFNIHQTELADDTEVETEEDQAQTGTGSLQYDKYRKTAEGTPGFTDKIRYCEGLEELIYGLLGNYKKEAYTKDGATVPNVFKYVFDFPVANAEELPFFTLWHGFSMTQDDGLCWNNAMLNTFELTTSQDDLPTINYEFASNYRNFRFPNPPRLFPTTLDKSLRRGENVTWYIGSVDATDEEMLNNPITCLTEGSFSINNNIENPPCMGDDFGENVKLLGTRESEGSLTMPWNDATKVLEYEFYNPDANGHFITKDMPHKQLWCKIESPGVMKDTTVHYSVLFKFPDVNIDNATRSLSGEDAMNLELPFSINENALESFMTAEVITDLYALRIDEIGLNRDEILA